MSRLLGLVVSDKKIFQVFTLKICFSLCDLDTNVCNGPEAFDQLLKRVIQGSILSSLVNLRGDVLKSNC